MFFLWGLRGVLLLIEEFKNENNGKVRHAAKDHRFESNLYECCEFDPSMWDGRSSRRALKV